MSKQVEYPTWLEINQADESQIEEWFLNLPAYQIGGQDELKWILISSKYYLGDETDECIE